MDRIVTTKKGKIRGVSGVGCTIFKGIPYAKPPVGELRWRAPEESEDFEGIYEADHFGAKAQQDEGGGDFYKKEFYENEEYSVPGSEDCLYLNIWAPKECGGKKLPVAFWIHGGAFMGGFGSEMEFDGEAYAERGVILVTVNYRLNVYGFLAHPWLCAENGAGVSGNYGTLDQIAALRWVYENIEAFGGDRHNITVFGQSAGAMSVQTLVSSELTGNMIAKAIMQSGGSYGQGLHRDVPMSEAMEYGRRFVELTGAKDITELRAMSADVLREPIGTVLGESFASGKGLFLIPNLDGHVLKQGYYETIDRKKIKDIPYLLGSNKNDIMVSKEDVEAGKTSMLYEGCLAFAHKMEEVSGKPSYVYYFTRQLPGDDEGAFHSAELWYMFGTLERCWRPMTEADRELSGRMLDYWTHFMKSGDPNGAGLPEWRPCRKEDSFVMEFDV